MRLWSKIQTGSLYLISILLLCFFTGSCGGGGGPSGNGTAPQSVIEIQNPVAEDTYTTPCNEVFIGGEPNYSASQWSSVSISWENNSSQGITTGTGQTSVNQCLHWFFGYSWYEDCDAGWWAGIPLALGSNTITVTAFDTNHNQIGRDRIVVIHQQMSYALRGRVTNVDGSGIFNMKIVLEGAGNYTYTNSNGDYELKCLGNGTHRVYPDPEGFYDPGRTFFNYMDWPFTPDHLSVEIQGSDVTGQDFETEVYEISGRVTNASGIGFINLDVTLTGADGKTSSSRTDANGYYSLLAPNGTYTLQPSPSFSFNPPSRPIEVNGSGVYQQDFSLQ